MVDPETGELGQLTPEYATMSRRPGIGRDWFEKYSGDVFPSDEVIARGQKSKPPRYYLDLLERQDPEAASEIKRERSRQRDRTEETPERLSVRKVCAEARADLFKRKLEESQ